MHPLMKHLLEEHQNVGTFGLCGARCGQINSCNALSFDCETFIFIKFCAINKRNG